MKQKRYSRGWFGEPRRHSLARRGIKTGRKQNYSLGADYAKKPLKDVKKEIKNNKDDITTSLFDAVYQRPEFQVKSREVTDVSIRRFLNFDLKKKQFTVKCLASYQTDSEIASDYDQDDSGGREFSAVVKFSKSKHKWKPYSYNVLKVFSVKEFEKWDW